MKKKYLSEAPAISMPYQRIESLRPESKQAVEEFLFMQKHRECN